MDSEEFTLCRFERARLQPSRWQPSWEGFSPLRSTVLGGRPGAGWLRHRLRKQLADAIRHLRALRNPIINAIALEIDMCRRAPGIVCPHHLDRAPITRPFLFNDDNSVLRLFARTRARQSNH